MRTGSRVVAFEETGRDVRVELATGEEVRGDLLVGADGLRSQTRQQLMGEREARFTGVVVWRGLIPREKVPAALRREDHVLVRAAPPCPAVPAPA